jgi:hypothetical protein
MTVARKMAEKRSAKKKSRVHPRFAGRTLPLIIYDIIC